MSDINLSPWQRYDGLCKATIELEDLLRKKRLELLGYIADGNVEMAVYQTDTVHRIAIALAATDRAFSRVPVRR